MSQSRMYAYRWKAAWVLVAAAAIGGAVWHGQTSAQQQSDPNGIAKARSLSRAFRGAARRVMPTVVKIQTTTKPQKVEQSRGRMPRQNPFKGTPFEDFFDNDDLRGNRFHNWVPRQRGVGSGVIIDPKGIVLTNNHVVEGADEVVVQLADGRQLKATDIKTDAQTDLAVLRIEAADPLPAARLGNSDEMEIGDWVLAIGNPFRQELTVSAGIISGKGRSLAFGKRVDYLQTDAAINPGNSGGPLVNLDGEVVGINTAIASTTGGYQGVGFSIPVNLAKWVTGQLIKSGSVQRAYLGVGIGEINDQLARKLGVRRDRGVLVSEVFSGTPASAAGFEVGDVIVAYGGRRVDNPRQLQEAVERSPAGSRQKVELIRDGKPKSLHVVVKPLPGDFGTVLAGPSRVEQGEDDSSRFNSKKLGMEVTELTEPLARQLGHEGFTGVLISEVSPTGIAAEAGIREGMLILRVGKKPVKSVAEFEVAAKAESLEEGILLLVRTRHGNRFVVLQKS